MLIGLVQNPDYIEQLNFRRHRLEKYIRRVQEDTAIGLGDESELIRLRNLTVKKYQIQLDFLVPWIESAEEFYYPTRE